ncbi:MAG: hypothetical protein IT529_06315 [Burkholderiales bacterium]|nr:hypothetical protein [Burkholderiales bacterium]
MADKPDNVAAVRESWGKAAPEWVVALAEACDRGSQAQVAKALGVSPTQVNQTVHNTYGGRLDRLEQRVRGTLMNQKVACPVLGEITRRRCIDEQGRRYAATNELRIELRRACPRCPNRLDKESA